MAKNIFTAANVFSIEVLRFNALMVNVIALQASFMFRNGKICSKSVQP